MANLVSLPNPTQDIIQKFISQMDQSQSDRERLALEQQQIDNNKTYQSGLLGNDTTRTNLAGQKYADDRLDQLAADYKQRLSGYYDALQSEQDPTKKQALALQLKSEIEQMPAAVKDRLRANLQEPVMTPERQSVLNASRAAADATGRTAAGGTAPNDFSITTKIGPAQAFPTPQMFTQQQATDLGNRDQSGQTTPDLSAKIPAPSGNAVSDYEARATNAMPTSAENLTSQTSKDTTQMQISAEAPYRAAMTREASAKAAIAEGQQKMMSGDPSAPNSFAVGVMLNPRSFKSLTTDEKRMAVAGLGGRAPAELGQQEENALSAAENTKDGVKRAAAVLQKWQQRGVQITGPMIGRLNAATNQWGDSILPSGLPPDQAAELQADIAILQQNFGINKLNELHAVIGGRVPTGMAQMIQAPTIAQNPNMLAGALWGMYQIADGRSKDLENKIWNGHPPQLSAATLAKYQQDTTPAAQPAPSGAFNYVQGHGLVPVGQRRPQQSSQQPTFTDLGNPQP